MNARDIMTGSPAVVTPNEMVARAAELMRELNVGALPVVTDRSSLRLAGIITDRDIVVRCVAHRHSQICRVRDHMTIESLATVHPDDDVAQVMAVMERQQIRRVPVVDETGEVVGIIAQSDLATKLGPQKPAEIEHLLERISTPSHVALAPA